MRLSCLVIKAIFDQVFVLHRIVNMSIYFRGCQMRGEGNVPSTTILVQAMKKAEDFNSSWDKSLSLFKNDCRHHSAQLAKLLLNNPYWEPSSV